MAVKDWFDADYYFQSKLAQLGSPWNELTLKKAFTDAGYEGEEGLYQHFLDFGNAEGVSPNKYFDANYYVQAKAADYFGVSAEAVTPDQITFIKKAFADNGMTAWDHYTEYGTTEEIDPSANFDTSVYLTNKLAAWNKEDPLVEHDMAELKAVLKNAGYNAVSHYLDYGRDEEIAIADSAAHGAAAQSLTSGDDILYGTTGSTKLDEQGSVSVNTNYDDVFNAGAGTLGNNDVINGLGGVDTLNAVLTNKTTIQPTLKSVEVVKFQAQESAGSQQATTNYNNITHSQIDAGNISGMTQLWDTDSRATLIVEDVRTDSNKLDLYMQDTDPGDVDFGVYFNPLNLKSDTTSSNDTATLQVMDVKNAQLSGGESPLTEQPFDKFTFDYASTSGTVQVALQFRAADKALYTGKDATYDTLLTAFNNALDDYEAANPSMAGLFEITKGGAFSATTSVKGTTYTSNAGFDVKIAAVGGTIDVVAEGTGWGVQSGNVPSVGGIVWNAVTDPDSTCPLIVTDLYLDNVGKVNWDATPDSDCLPDDVLFGSQAGDVVIGSMADRGGVERINVTVDEGSWLSTLASTNETLRMVTAVNGVVEGVNDKGNLFIGQSLVPTGSDRNLATWADAAKYLSTDGLKDVAVFDAATFEGQINLGASITESSFDKYLKDVDDVDSTTVKDAPLSGYNGEFTYNLGVNNDTLNMKVNGGIAADNDFALAINTGDGADTVRFAFDAGTKDGQTPFNSNFATSNELADQMHLRNVEINTGNGNDVIELPGAGRVVVDAGAGNDVIYADNTGGQVVKAGVTSKAVWAFNDGGELRHNAAADADDVSLPTDRAIYVDEVNGAQPLDNDFLAVNNEYTVVRAASSQNLMVQVVYQGTVLSKFIDVATIPAESGTTTTEMVTSLQVNKAIIEAINNDAVLSKMIVAKDAASHGLLVESLVDGVSTTPNDLAIEFYLGVDTDGNPNPYTNEAIDGDYTTQMATTEAVVTTVSTISALTDNTNYSVTIDDVTYTGNSGVDNTLQAVLDGLTSEAGVNANTIYTMGINPEAAAGEFSVFKTDDPTAEVTVAAAAANQLPDAMYGDPTEAYFNVIGADSLVESDNILNGSTGDDILVLGTGEFSNDIVVFESNFGDDTVLNFSAGTPDRDNGHDIIDFSSFGINHATVSTTPPDEKGSFTNDTVYVATAAMTTAEALAYVKGLSSTADTTSDAVFMFYNLEDALGEDTYTVIDVHDSSTTTTSAAVEGTVQLVGVAAADLVSENFQPADYINGMLA